MNGNACMYDWFARMLSYPNRDTFLKDGNADWNSGDGTSSANGLFLGTQITRQLEEFRNGVDHLPIEEREELYTRTFDINPVASLEAGWHLYGEQYERGAFLVKMRQMLHRHFIEESSELPDHLCHVLVLLGRLEKKEADAFAVTYVIPALKKISEAFVETTNPYKHLFQALMSFIEERHIITTSNSQQGVVTHDEH